MRDFDDHEKVLAALTACQEAEKDLREQCREAHLFVDKRDGQWEPYWWTASDGKPRYTFDMTSTIVQQIAGTIQRKDFDIKIRPADGATSKTDAIIYDGMVRHIENAGHPAAKHVFATAGRNMVTAGVDGWHIVQDYEQGDSFDQHLCIEPIANYLDCVWFDVGAKKQDMSDAGYCFVLEAIPKDEYEEDYPDGSGQSVPCDRTGNAYYDKADQIVIGQVYYKKETERELVKLNTGEVFVYDDDFKAIEDDLPSVQKEIVGRRTVKDSRVWSRLFDGKDWLDEEEETVFSMLPVIPAYGNFKVFEDKILYRGVVEKLLDPQRVYNYGKSREIEEGALAPRAKYWMTKDQAAGHEATLQTLNTNADPVQFYNADPTAPGPPQQVGGAMINEGLTTLTASMKEIFTDIAGWHAANQGDNPGLQSGIALEKLQDRGDVSTVEYETSMEIAIAQTGRVLVDAIPRVYAGERQVQLLGADGNIKPIVINQEIFDEATQRMVVLNDLSKGKYTVTCSAGPSFQNRQQETVATITEIAAVDPSVLEVGGDVLFGNMSAPGMDLIAARKRAQLVTAGIIPPDQMTPEETQAAEEAAKQPPPPDPNLIIAEAESKKADAQTNKIQVEAQVKSAQLQLAERKEQRETATAQGKMQLQQMELVIRQQQQRFEQMLAMQQQTVEALNMQADTLRILREAMGVEAIVSPTGLEAYREQIEEVTDAQIEPNSATPRLPGPNGADSPAMT